MTIEVTNETKIDFVTARKELGDGPMRFAPTGERSIAEQIAALLLVAVQGRKSSTKRRPSKS